MYIHVHLYNECKCMYMHIDREREWGGRKGGKITKIQRNAEIEK